MIDTAARQQAQRPTRAGAGRMLAGLGLALVVDAIIMLSAPAVLAAVLFVPPVGLAFALVFAAAIGGATAGALWVVTRKRQVVAGVAAALAGTVGAVALLVSAGEIPVHWIPALGVDVGVVPAAVFAVGAAAVALPRWWARLGGSLVVILSVAARRSGSPRSSSSNGPSTRRYDRSSPTGTGPRA
ncbi:hypothetical protein FJ656_12845 [Schumannella luteola]|nr:hypothetical protein FJ656_12845 [Schumannella luteola]